MGPFRNVRGRKYTHEAGKGHLTKDREERVGIQGLLVSDLRARKTLEQGKEFFRGDRLMTKADGVIELRKLGNVRVER